MRARELFERASQEYYLHCTATHNLASILKHGLIPNHSNDGNGNYDDFAWLSLEGIYATRYSSKISHYAGAHDLQSFLICVLAVTPQSVLPDEDTINIILGQCVADVRNRLRIGHDESLGGYYYENEQGLNEFINFVSMAFHKRCVSPGDPREADMELLNALVWNYLGHTHEQDWETDSFSYKDEKDAVTRRYKKMAHPRLGHGWSIRIPNAVGFSGRNRIVAIVEVMGDEAKTVWGKVPPDAQSMVDDVVDAQNY